MPSSYLRHPHKDLYPHSIFVTDLSFSLQSAICFYIFLFSFFTTSQLPPDSFAFTTHYYSIGHFYREFVPQSKLQLVSRSFFLPSVRHAYKSPVFLVVASPLHHKVLLYQNTFIFHVRHHPIVLLFHTIGTLPLHSGELPSPIQSYFIYLDRIFSVFPSTLSPTNQPLISIPIPGNILKNQLANDARTATDSGLSWSFGYSIWNGGECTQPQMF